MSQVAGQRWLSEDELQMNGVALDAAKTSAIFNVQAMTDITIYYEWTRVAGTKLTFELFSYDPAGSPFPWLAGSIAAGVDTLSPYSLQRTVSATEKGRLPPIKLNDSRLAIKVTCTAGGATDTIKVKACLGCLPS